MWRYPVLSRWPTVITKVLMSEEGGREFVRE